MKIGSSGVDGLRVAADHRAVAVDQAPDAAADAGVDEVDVLGLHQLVAALGVLEVGVAAVDDRVAGLEQRGELVHRLFSRIAGGDHQPHDARGAEHAHDFLRRQPAFQALAHDLARFVGRPIERDHPMTRLVQPPGHVPAHSAEADDRELHVLSPLAGKGIAERLIERGEELGQAGVRIV